MSEQSGRAQAMRVRKARADSRAEKKVEKKPKPSPEKNILADEPGWRTTEFWTMVVTVITATVLRYSGDISDEMWAVVVSGNGGAYTISRAALKIKRL